MNKLPNSDLITFRRKQKETKFSDSGRQRNSVSQPRKSLFPGTHATQQNASFSMGSMLTMRQQIRKNSILDTNTSVPSGRNEKPTHNGSGPYISPFHQEKIKRRNTKKIIEQPSFLFRSSRSGSLMFNSSNPLFSSEKNIQELLTSHRDKKESGDGVRPSMITKIKTMIDKKKSEQLDLKRHFLRANASIFNDLTRNCNRLLRD